MDGDLKQIFLAVGGLEVAVKNLADAQATTTRNVREDVAGLHGKLDNIYHNGCAHRANDRAVLDATALRVSSLVSQHEDLRAALRKGTDSDTRAEAKRSNSKVVDLFKLGWIQTAGRPAILLTSLIAFAGVLTTVLYTVTAIQTNSFRADMEGLKKMIERRLSGDHVAMTREGGQ